MLELNKLYLGDCLDVMNGIEDHSVDAIICDLPYEVTAHSDDKIIPFEPLWEQYKRVIKENGAIVLFAQGMFYIDLVCSNREWFRYDLVWDKVLPSGFLNSGKMPLRVHEQIAVFYGKPPVYNPQMTKGAVLHGRGKYHEIENENYGKYGFVESREDGMKFPNSILTFQKPHASVAQHRTEKSIPLLEWLVKTYTNKGELVLDNTCGSATLPIACFNTGRNFIGIEKDAEIFAKAKERLRVAMMKKKLF